MYTIAFKHTTFYLKQGKLMYKIIFNEKKITAMVIINIPKIETFKYTGVSQ